MKKILSILLLSLLVVGCSSTSNNTSKPAPGPLVVETPVESPEVVPEKDPSEVEEESILPVGFNEIPVDLTLLEPNSIGTIYVEAFYTNGSSYPMTSYTLKILKKDTNETGYLSSYDTVMPGENSPIFDTFGPESGNPEDLELLTLDATFLTDEGELYIEYDLKLNRAEWWYAN